MFDPESTLAVNRVMIFSLLTHLATGLEYLHGLNIIHGGALCLSSSCRGVLIPAFPSPPASLSSLLASPWRLRRRGLRYRGLSPLLRLRADLTPSNVLLKLDRSERSGVVAKLTVSPG